MSSPYPQEYSLPQHSLVHVNFFTFASSLGMDVEQMHARRLLSHAAATAVASPGPAAAQGSGTATATVRRSAHFSSLDATVITILSLLLCALVVALVIHAFVRCAFRVTRRVCYGQDEAPGAEAVSEGIRAGTTGGGKKKAKGGAIRGLPTLLYSAEIELAVCSSTECAICLAEFAQGEHVRVLPRCNHGFHVRCIDRWLSARQTCPTCRREPFAKPALPARAEELAPAAVQVQVQVHVEAGQPETLA